VAIECRVVLDLLPWPETARSDQQQECVGGADFLGELRQPESRAKGVRGIEEFGVRLQAREARAYRLRKREVLRIEREEYAHGLLSLRCDGAPMLAQP
jgi:hypothetical protein